MSSTGQIVGGIVGTAIGAYMGNPVMGAQIGMTVGGMIDPPAGPKLKQPSLGDLQQQTSTYGAPIPRSYSTITVKGNCIWLKNNKLDIREVEMGGKGAPPASASAGAVYEYRATLAIGLANGVYDKIGRIWVSGKLVYDPFATELKKVRKSNKFKKKCAFYLGDQTEADPTIQADRGVAYTPAYKGLCYIVIRNFLLTDYGNSLAGAEFEVELIKEGAQNGLTLIDSVSAPYKPPTDGSYATGNNPHVFVPYPYYMGGKKVIWYCPNYDQDTVGNPSSYFTYQTTDTKCVFLGESQLASDVGYEQSPQIVGDDPDLYWLKNEWAVGDDADITALRDGVARHVGGYNVGLYNDILWICKNEFSPALQDIIKQPDIYKLEVTDCFAATLDTTGNYVYACFDDGIRTYTKELEAVDFFPHTFAYGTGGISGCCFDISTDGEDGEVLWIFKDLDAAGAYVWKYVVESDTLTYVDRLDAQLCNTTYGCVPHVQDGIITIARFDSTNDELAVDWYFEGAATKTNQTLGEIVEEECLKSNLLTAGDLDVTDLTQEVRGYKITDIAAIRASLEHLQTAFQFDVIQHGYQLKFVNRGQASARTYTTDDLAIESQLTQNREMDTQIPRKVVIKYIDAENREYGIGEQYCERLTTDAVSVHEKQLAIVLSEDEAAQVAEKLLYIYWLERNSFEFTLPPDARDLEPSDVITITADYGSYEIRLTSINYNADGRLQCTGKANSVGIHTSTAVGSAGQVTDGDIAGNDADTAYVLLDIPCINDTYLNTPSFYIALAGDEDDWTGGVVLRSTDSGANYNQVASSPYPTTYGICQDALADVQQPYMINAGCKLNVQFVAGTPSSVTQAQMLNGSNTFAYGAHGRWEIVAIQTWTLESDGTYTGTQMLRGLYGSISHASEHVQGDKLVYLNDADLKMFLTPTNSIGLSYLYRGISFGEDLDTDTDLSFAYNAVNLKPLAPVHVSYYRDSSSNINIAWKRQDRFVDDLRNYVEEPMSESTEAYRTFIYSDSNYDTVLREIASTSESCQYTLAQQVADGTSGDTNYYIAVYQISSVVGYGYPSVDVATANPPFDPYFANVSLLLHFDGTDASTTFTDSSSNAHTATVNGNAQLDTAQKLYGTASGLFDGTGDYITFADHASFELGSGDFTFEIAVRFNALPSASATAVLINKGTVALSNIAYGASLYNDAGTYKIRFNTSSDGTTVTTNQQTVSVVTGGFYKFAFSRVGSTLYFFQDGALLGSVTDSTNIFNGGGLFAVGATQSGGSPLNGWIDELRLTKSVGRYNATYTDSGLAFPNI